MVWGGGFGFPLGPTMLKIQPVTVVKGIKASAKWHMFDVVYSRSPVLSNCCRSAPVCRQRQAEVSSGSFRPGPLPALQFRGGYLFNLFDNFIVTGHLAILTEIQTRYTQILHFRSIRSQLTKFIQFMIDNRWYAF